MKKRALFGLGNPGIEYRLTRHNIGYRVVEALAATLHAPPFQTGRYALHSQITWRGIQWNLFLPTTYMNRSGDAVAYWKKQIDVELSEIIVILDEIQLPFGTLRLTPKGGAGGHNGLQHIIETLKSTAFPRLRVGIDKNFPMGKQVEYVLSPFTAQEEKHLEQVLSQAAQALITWGIEGIDRAASLFNRSFSTLAE
ncbi:MAG: aminoacyl-tRNA hydrolase [Bacteroidia bacterium]|nr:aminoacyl-tRNA hydrolase [Bacteroidia bacterium]MDW8235773.1 aminoacyl-tRNA hydrolase [Bacteroidia bacterium]